MSATHGDPRGESVPVDGGLILDLFAGPGGWSEGLRMLGLSDVGIEMEAGACRTRAAAGHRTIRADVAAYPPEVFVGKVWGLIASPPCQDFSMAGKRAGRTGAKGELIDTVPPWVDVIRPEWIVCEQTPLALPVWEEFARLFAEWGYSTWTGILNAADYGVPQVRLRAVLLAARWPVAPPVATHAQHPHPSMFGPQELPWVSMVEGIGWGLTDRPAYTFCGSNEGGMDIAGGSGARAAIKLAMREGRWVVDRRTNSKDGRGGMYPTVVVPMDRPAPTLTGKAMGQWRLHEADDATTWAKLSVADALAIQSFRPDFPVTGNKSQAGEQIGNAVPPLMAARIIEAVACGQPAEVAA